MEVCVAAAREGIGGDLGDSIHGVGYTEVDEVPQEAQEMGIPPAPGLHDLVQAREIGDVLLHRHPLVFRLHKPQGLVDVAGGVHPGVEATVVVDMLLAYR